MQFKMPKKELVGSTLNDQNSLSIFIELYKIQLLGARTSIKLSGRGVIFIVKYPKYIKKKNKKIYYLDNFL